MRTHRTIGLLATGLAAISLLLGPTAGPPPAAAAPPAPSVVATIPVGRDAAGIVADATGIWVTGWYDRTLSRIDPATNAVAATYPLTLTAGGPEAIASGLGSLWVTTTAWNDADASVAGSVLRVTPATGAVVATIPIGRNALSIAVGGAAVWVANKDDGTITRIDPATNTVAATIPLADVVTVAASGDAAWAATKSGTIVRIDPATNAVAQTVTTDAKYPLLALGDGALWATSDATGASATTRLLRIDPATGAITATIPLVGVETGGIAAAPGSVWVAFWETASVVRVDTAAKAVAATVPVIPQYGQAIAATATDAWLLGYTTRPFLGDSSPNGSVLRIGLGVAPPPASVTWKASMGTAGANGSAVLAATGARGTLKLALKGLTKNATYPVKVMSGTCARPAVTLWTAPSQKATAAGRIAKSLTIPSANAAAIRAAGAVGPVSLRVGSGSRLRCGLLTAGPAGAPAPTPVPTATPVPTPTPTATPAPTPTPVPTPTPGAGGTVFTGPYFTVTLPAGWSKASKQPDDPDAVIYSGPRGSALLIDSHPSDGDLGGAVIDAGYALYVVIGSVPESTESITMGGVPGKLLTTHGTIEGYRAYAMIAVCLSGGRMYDAIFLGDAGHEATDSAFMLSTLSSMVLRSTR